MQPIVTDRIAWSVSRSVCQSVTPVSPAKTAEPIEMPFGLTICMGQGNQIPIGRGNFFGGEGRPIVKYRDTGTLWSSVQRQELIEMLFGIWVLGSDGARESCVR